jgi:hypothetical protein
MLLFSPIVRHIVLVTDKDQINPITGPDRPRGFQEDGAPRFEDIRHMNVVRLSALRTGRLYPPGNIPCTHFCSGTAVAQWLRRCATNRKVAGSIPADVSGFFIDIKSFRSHYGPGIDTACNRNEYQDYFLGVKSGRCVRLTILPPSCAVVT